METTRRIVTHARGSWKYQDAFAIVTYTPRRTRSGRLVWSRAYAGPKQSEPQIRRAGMEGLPHGTAHNRPISEEDQAFRAAFPPAVRL